MRDGIELNADVFRPEVDGAFPAIVSFHPYEPVGQWAPGEVQAFGAMRPNQERGAAAYEAGDPNFFVRRGYAHVITSIRGTATSGGAYPFLNDPEPLDGYDLVEWVARQPWCDGNVGMFGVSYLGRIQYFVASAQPPHLRCIFAPWGGTDLYRDSLYHGGILAKNWAQNWPRGMTIHHYNSECRAAGEDAYRSAIDQALADPDLRAEPGIVAPLQSAREANDPTGKNDLVADILTNPHDNAFWDKRRARYQDIKVPVYTGADWGIFGLHLPAAFRSWLSLNTPKKMVIGPPCYIERPVYQPAYESLRWFDYWLKGMDTRIMDEPNVRMFISQTRRWRTSSDWPLPETRWTPLYLHEGGVLWEHEHFPNEGCSSFSDSPWGRGGLEFTTPKLVEDTEVIGPIGLTLYGSTTDDEVLWFASLREVFPDGGKHLLTRGWLRGSHRAIDQARSQPWAPYHPHDHSQPLEPGKIYEFQIGLVPTGQLLKAGTRLELRISCTDDQPNNAQENLGSGHLRRQAPSRVTVFHNEDYPSELLLPVTSGNVMGLYISGGEPYL